MIEQSSQAGEVRELGKLDKEKGLARAGFEGLPPVVADAGEQTRRRFVEFFTANIRNKNTRLAYGRAVRDFFAWCEERRIDLRTIEPIVVAAYVEQLQTTHAAPSVKQHLTAVRMLFDYFVTGQVVPFNPASSGRGPKHFVKRGKTPVLKAQEARLLFDSIRIDNIAGLRGRALIGVMVYSFSRVGAVVGMRVEDYNQQGKRWWLRLHEKGGKRHELPAHHNAEAYLDEYLDATTIRDEPKSPLFRSISRNRQLTHRPMNRTDALLMIKRRCRSAGLPATINCHSFRATGITAYLSAGGTIENAQAIAAHESPRTTKLYDRTADEITLDEVERIAI